MDEKDAALAADEGLAVLALLAQQPEMRDALLDIVNRCHSCDAEFQRRTRAWLSYGTKEKARNEGVAYCAQALMQLDVIRQLAERGKKKF